MSRAATVENPEVIRLSRQVEALTKVNRATQIKLARAEADKLVEHLERVDGIDFSDSDGKNADQNRKNAASFLADLDDQSRETYVNQVIRKHYRRKQPDPTIPAYPGVARYARADEGTPNPEEFEPKTPQEAMMLAELQTGPKKMSLPDAIKFMRSGHR